MSADIWRSVDRWEVVGGILAPVAERPLTCARSSTVLLKVHVLHIVVGDGDWEVDGVDGLVWGPSCLMPSW